MSRAPRDRDDASSGSASGLTATFFDLANPAARAAYGALWTASPQRTPFAHLAFGDAASRAFGLGGRILGVMDDAGAWRGGLLVFERRLGPVRVSAHPPLAPYLAPVLDGPLDAAAVHARTSPLDALAGALGRRYPQATLALPPGYADARPLAWGGWRLEPRYTYATELPAGADPARWSSATRRLTKRAEGLRLDEDPGHARAAATRMREAFARGGVDFRVDDGAAAQVAGALVDAGLARVFAALPEGEATPEAALVVAHDGRTAYYWIAGSRPGPAMTVLLAHALRRIAEAGMTTFDWCGANTPSVAEFKRRFGAALAPVVRARWARPGVFRALDRLRGH